MLKKLLLLVFSAAVLVASGLGIWAWQGLKTLDTPVALDEAVLFSVPSGTSYDRVARQFNQQGWLTDSLWMRIYGRLHPEVTALKAGQYEFTDGLTPRQMIDKMVAGDIKSWQIQFIEGWTFSDLRKALDQDERLKKETGQWTDEQVMVAVGAEGEHPEGRFFPDTYRYVTGDSDLDILQRAFDRMEEVLAEEWEAREEGLPYKTPYEALIMASIVERETGVEYERGDVAGVFVRRLQKGMRLQTDPTVIYGMGDNYKGNITRRDLRTYTPYNTYRINGLPPTPIALPGREAIHAALHPKEGEALYFVARGDGTHQFSNTLAEHQAAVRQYQLNRRQNYRSSPPPEQENNQ